jgi:Rho GDP-dissociation inhibitor
MYQNESTPSSSPFVGYKPSAAKTAEEYAKLDAEDESLARWKASLGIVPGGTGVDTSKPKVLVRCLCLTIFEPCIPCH